MTARNAGAAVQNVIVFGAGSGIGRATAEHLAQQGDTVYLVDRDQDAVEGIAATLRGAGADASAIGADITDRQALEAAFATAVGASQQIHAVVNSVGIQGPLGVRSHEVDLDAFDRVYSVNLRAALSLSQVAISHMLPRRYGRIAHVASIAGKEGNPGMIGYSTTKAGLIGMVKAQGKEYATDGITINALAPAVIQTAFLDTQPEEVISYMTEKIPMRRTGTVDEAATMLAFMISPACSFTTGFTFDLSGGRATY